MNNKFFGKSYLTVDQIEKEDILYLFEKVDEMKKLVESKGGNDELKGKVLAALFYEPSSRTFSSFLSAMQRLGGGIIPMHGMSYSSVAKGESLRDTVKTFSCFVDILVIRNPEVGSAQEAAKYATVPVINAGDGTGEHPTQALQDVYTIKSHFSDIATLTVGMVGDLKNGRTVHSLTKMILKFGVKKFVWVSPKILMMPQEIRERVEKSGGETVEVENLNDVIGDLDVMYDTRVQKERFTDLAEYERLKLAYIITPDVMKKAKKNMIVMHPLPRVGEIAYEVDRDPRAVYLTEQMRNGVFIRMALLKLILTI